MPLYEYLCEACSQRFELIQKFSDPAPDACPKCGKGPVERQHSSPAIQFKGSGWYITDYARKGGSSSSGEAGAKSSSGESTSSGDSSGGDSQKSEPKKADTAPASGTASSSSDKSGSSDKSDKSDKSGKSEKS